MPRRPVTLAGLEVHADMSSPHGLWADCIVDELVATARRKDDAAAAMLLLALVLGAPRTMRITLPSKPVD